jgi:hypothetical protein
MVGTAQIDVDACTTVWESWLGYDFGCWMIGTAQIDVDGSPKLGLEE